MKGQQNVSLSRRETHDRASSRGSFPEHTRSLRIVLVLPSPSCHIANKPFSPSKVPLSFSLLFLSLKDIFFPFLPFLFAFCVTDVRRVNAQTTDGMARAPNNPKTPGKSMRKACGGLFGVALPL